MAQIHPFFKNWTDWNEVKQIVFIQDICQKGIFGKIYWEMKKTFLESCSQILKMRIRTTPLAIANPNTIPVLLKKNTESLNKTVQKRQYLKADL